MVAISTERDKAVRSSRVSEDSVHKLEMRLTEQSAQLKERDSFERLVEDAKKEITALQVQVKVRPYRIRCA